MTTHDALNRREFLQRSGALLGAAAFAAGPAAAAAPASVPAVPPAIAAAGPQTSTSAGEHRGRSYKSIKFGMFDEKISYKEKFQLLKDYGYDGVELNSPGGEDKKEALAASREVGLPIHGVVDSIHWGTRLSDPDPAVRERALKGLLTAIEETRFLGGTSVLLVPGKVSDSENENHDQVWERSIAEIRKALPLAAKLGIHVLIENVWNGFCYDHEGPNNQTAERLARYIDEIGSPWVGSYFDIGNHQKYGKPAEWIRTLGRRIVKLDVKDWGIKNGFCRIGEGDVDWKAVRAALAEIHFTGWCTAEVSGGDRKRIREIAAEMDAVLGL
jgi:hexulose-6-phosphate isomerase